MQKIIKSVLSVMLLLVANNSFGYFYYLCIKKVINKNGVPQLIVLLSDYHDKTHPANKDQRVYLESLLQKCSNKKVKLIVEDLGSVNNDGRMICCNFGINSTEGVLSNLANKARSLGIAVDNVEYRYCRVAGIGPLMSNITADPHLFRSSCAITLCSLYKEIMGEIEKIKKYNDGKKLNDYYKQAIDQVRTHLSRMNIGNRDCSKTIAHYCAQLKSRSYRKQLENLCIFDSELIDSNLIHSIMSCDEPIVLVAAGGSHIIEVNKLLEKNGAESVFIVSDHHQKPIDITIIDKFIIPHLK